jgi:hypothetical protein
MKSARLLLLCGAAAALFAPAAGRAAVYDAATDLTPAHTTNPNGVWSYGYDPAGAGYGFKAFDTFTAAGPFLLWTDSTYIHSGDPLAGKNISDTTATWVPPGMMVLHPGPAAYEDNAILRFTAPATGYYDARFQVFRGDAGTTFAWIVHNGNLATPLAALGSTDADPLYHDAHLALQAGDTLDVVVGNGGVYYGDTTPLTATIANSSAPPVPEPAAGFSMLAGLALIASRVLRRGR